MKKLIHACGLLVSILFLQFFSDAHAVGYTLTVIAQGSGTVARNPSNASYPPGVVVTVSATPNTNSYFSNWSGDTNGSVNPLNLTMNSSMVITGNFLAYPIYTVSLSTNGQGTISLNPSGGSYTNGAQVTLTSTPSAGWVFAAWSGSTNTSTNPLSITVTTNIALVGTFAQLPVFDSHPQTISNATGGAVNFSAHAIGSAPLGYQWFFNNSPIINATNTTLGLTNIQLSGVGNYWVRVTNNFGSATSYVASLVLTNLGGSTNAVNFCTEADLRAAIALGGWVSIHCNGTFTLTNTITISNSVILDATGIDVAINGNNSVRLFTVLPGASLAATNLTFANGSVTNSSPADGGAIYNSGGMVTLVACTLTNNRAMSSIITGGLARGGAIFNDGGSLSLFGTGIYSNSAVANFVSGNLGGGVALGGAVYSANGPAQIIGCFADGNLSRGNDGYDQTHSTGVLGPSFGGCIFQSSGFLLISNSSFTSNLARSGDGSANTYNQEPAYGGALYSTSGIVTIHHSQFTGNVAKGGNRLGGGHYPSPGYGGAIYCASVLQVENSIFSGNQALAGSSITLLVSCDGQGGAIYNNGSIVLNRCCIYSNYVQGANGGFLFGLPQNGGSGLGGAIFNSSELNVTNCTIALNTSVAGTGAGFTSAKNGNAMGGGVYNSLNATSILMNVTIARNSCIAGGSGFTGVNGFSAGDQIASTNGGTLRLHNSLIAYAGTNGNTFGTITDDGYNISSDGSAAFASGSSYNFTDPKLGPLADNGGPTLTMAPLAISPAIDFGDAANAPISDQRGLLRPFGDGVDMGAVEYGSIYPAPSPMNLNLSGTENLLLNFTASPPFTYHLQWSTNLTSWTDLEVFSGLSASSNVVRSFVPQGSSRKFFRVWYQ